MLLYCLVAESVCGIGGSFIRYVQAPWYLVTSQLLALVSPGSCHHYYVIERTQASLFGSL